jgi:Rrf2 family cysteine metabolism transcriptional repressor
VRLSSKEHVGLQAMVEFARRYGRGPTSLSEVARTQELPLPYLEQVIASLRRAGLLASARGAHGGYTLTRHPTTISVGDIFRAMEGSLITLDCTRPDGSPCTKESSCATRSVWQTVARRLSETLDHLTLADILGRDVQLNVPTPIRR